MKVLFYSGRPYDKISMESVNNGRHDLNFISPSLDERTALLAKGYPAVCGFVNDQFSADCLKILADGGTKLVLLRSTGFNNVDMSAAEANGITVMRVLALFAARGGGTCHRACHGAQPQTHSRLQP